MMSPTSVKTNRRGFTLIEMLVVIGILGLLAGILLPATIRVLRSAERTKAAADLQTIAVALEAYKSNFEDYPRLPDGNLMAAPGPRYYGSDLLVRALIGPFGAAIDGADGMGFRKRTQQGQVYGPYLQVEKFKLLIDSAAPATGCELRDRNDSTILYIPARPAKPNINAGTGFIDASANALYDTRYIETGKFSPANAFNYLMGDVGTPNGRIDAGDEAATTGPYILWSAGPDSIFGISTLSATDAAKCDDVTNFK